MFFDNIPNDRRKNVRKGKGNYNNLSVPARNVLETLQKLAHRELICGNNLSTLIKASGHSKKTVQKYLEELEECGYIRRCLYINELSVFYSVTPDDPKEMK